LEIAAGLARQSLLDVNAPAEGGDPQPALDRVFVRALCREPSAAERRVLRDYFERQARAFADDPESASALLPASGSMKQWPPEFPGKVKNVIYLFMAGGPSQLELFDDKPKLREFTGQAPPASLMQGKRFAFLKGNETLLGSARKFERAGQCGMTLSELLPHHK